MSGTAAETVDVVQFLPVVAAAALETFLVTRLLHEYPSHGFGRRGEEMAAAVPRRRGTRSFALHQAQVRLMNEGRGLDRLSRRLSSELLGRESS